MLTTNLNTVSDVLWWEDTEIIVEMFNFVDDIYSNESTKNRHCFKQLKNVLILSITFFDLSFPLSGWAGPGISRWMGFLLLDVLTACNILLYSCHLKYAICGRDGWI